METKDLNAILDEVNPEGKEEDTSTEDTSTEETSTEEETTVEENTSDESNQEEQTESPDDSNQNNSVIKNLRTNYREAKNKADEMSKTLERIAKLNNMTVDEYLAKLNEQDLNNQAKTNNISPELQKRLNEQEQKLQQFEEDRVKNRFLTNIETLQSNNELSRAQVEAFIDQTRQIGVDLLNTPIDFNSLYFALNRDSILEAEREKVRQQVLAEIDNNNNRAPKNTRGAGDGNQKIKGTIDDALNELFK